MADVVLQALRLWMLLIREFVYIQGDQDLSSEAASLLVIEEISPASRKPNAHYHAPKNLILVPI
jgi:hypothetical protein